MLIYLIHSQAIVFQDLRLTIIEAQSITRLGAAFNFKCRITNTSAQSMDLMLSFRKKASANGSYTGQTEFMVSKVTRNLRKCIRIL